MASLFLDLLRQQSKMLQRLLGSQLMKYSTTRLYERNDNWMKKLVHIYMFSNTNIEIVNEQRR